MFFVFVTVLRILGIASPFFRQIRLLQAVLYAFVAFGALYRESFSITLLSGDSSLLFCFPRKISQDQCPVMVLCSLFFRALCLLYDL